MRIDVSKLQALRKQRGWSINALAKAAGLSYSTVYEAERQNRVPQIATTKALADALGCEVADLELTDDAAEAAS